ncbi:MAG: cupin domain-containing protein [Ruminococcaceae bacterium]|nr:cupin domain-containing protein [Oscillospiraceae bacterium]
MDKALNYRMDLSWMKFEFSPCSASFDKREYECDRDFVRHTHDFSQLIYCFKGRVIHTVGDTRYECISGEAVIIPPGIFHEFSVEKGSIVGYLNTSYNAFTEETVKKYPAAVILGIFPRDTSLMGGCDPSL